MAWFQIVKGVCQGCILSPCFLNLYAEFIMTNAGLDEAQAEIVIAGRNIKNLRYADDTIRNDFGAPQNKVSHCFHCFSIYFHEVMGPVSMIFVF